MNKDIKLLLRIIIFGIIGTVILVVGFFSYLFLYQVYFCESTGGNWKFGDGCDCPPESTSWSSKRGCSYPREPSSYWEHYGKETPLPEDNIRDVIYLN